MIYFLHPDHDRPSGGNVYNRHIIQHVSAEGFPLRPVVVAADAICAEWLESLHTTQEDWLLWDSLFTHQLAGVVAAMPNNRHALLMHYLASENPQLAAVERERQLAIEQRAADSVLAFIATGHGIAEKLQHRYPNKPVWVVQPGVDSLFLSQAMRDDPDQTIVHLLTVANLLPAKGHLDILAMLSRLSERNWCWHIAGDDQRDVNHVCQLQQAIAATGLSEGIIFHGMLSQAELAQLMGKMHIFVFASHYEAYGMALAEAVAAGLPVVATRVGETRRLVYQGINGFLSDVGDRLGFQDHLEQLIVDKTLRRQMQNAASRLIPTRNWQQAGGDFISAWLAIQARR